MTTVPTPKDDKKDDQQDDKPALLICGYGTGISHSVAVYFGQQGYVVYLVARNADKLGQAVQTLDRMGIHAHGVVCDLADMDSLDAMLTQMQTVATLEILHWNAFVDIEGDILTADPQALSASLQLRVVNYLHTVQTLLPTLEHRQGAVMATSGIMAIDRDEIDEFAQSFGVLAVSVGAQYKLNALLARQLRKRHVHLAQVVVAGFVHHTLGNAHRASIHPDDVAKLFWQMLRMRQTHSEFLYPSHD